MSQFILFSSNKEYKQFEKIDDIFENRAFFDNVSKIFGKNKIIYTIIGFHELCNEAGEILQKDGIIENSNLYNVLKIIQNEEIVLWYSSDIDRLDEIENFDDLIESIKKTLKNKNADWEIYIHFKNIVEKKRQFLYYLDFPVEWFELGLYTDELFNIQKADLLKNIYQEGLEERISSEKYGGGSEHYRYGAFFHVLKNNDISILDKLKIVVENEPDIFLKKAMLKDIDNYQKL